MASFKGTSTDREYTVGQSYTMGGQSWTAQSDGSFSNSKTGQSLVGSSQEMADDKYRDKSDTAYILGGIKSGAITYVPPSQSTSGPGNGLVVSGPGNPGSGPGVPNAVQAGRRSTGITLSGAGPEKTTELYSKGKKLAIDKSTSDGADWEDRWGEWGGGLAGLWVMANDLATMADVKHGGIIRNDRVVQDMSAAPAVIRDGMIDFAGYLDERRRENLPGRMTSTGELYKTGGGF